MKHALIALAVAFFSTFSFAADKAADPFAADIAAARSVIDRVAPKLSPQVDLQIFEIGSNDSHDVFEIEQVGDRIVFRGKSALSLTSAAGWYLKHVAGCDISWCGSQLNIPTPLPVLKEKIRQTCPTTYRAYFNYCTLSYTASWWDWPRWEREIDFMALQGLNMPLMITGQEGVWYNTLTKLGYSDEEARKFLVGPCYFAWQFMANIEQFGGPLPKSWIDSHVALGQQIIARERELGMKPILQGFTGYVPRSLKDKFPDAAIKLKPNWCGFTGAAQLDPLDPLFVKFANVFYDEQKKLFGPSRYYAADPFHESAPVRPGDDYLRDVAKTIEKTMIDADPDAVICMQSWSIRKPIATSISKDRLLVLDIGSRYAGAENFWDYPFVAGIIHNFGGRTRQFGNIAGMANNPFTAAQKKAPNCVGMGLFPEAIDNNPVYFGLALDMIWRDTGVNVDEWLGEYATRRYGAESASAKEAWQSFKKTIYSPGTGGASSILCARPALNVKMSDPNWGFASPYDCNALVDGWKQLLADGDKLKASDAYLYDVADVGRQILSDYAMSVHGDFMQAYTDKNPEKMAEASKKFIDIELAADKLVGTRPELSFERWQEDALKWATNDEEKKLYAFNATCLVTQWGADGDSRIFEYSWREWSGLLRDYYAPRWKQFHDFLIAQVKEKQPYSEDGLPQVYGRPALRSNEFFNKLADWELNWIHSDKQYAPFQRGDTVRIARDVLAQFEPDMREAFKTRPNDRLSQLRAKISLAGINGAKAFAWTPKDCSTKLKTWKIDVSKLLVDTGEYTVVFQWEKGGQRLDIAGVKLLQNGSVVSEDKHSGSTGHANEKNTYHLKREEPIFNAKFELEISCRSDGGTESYGSVLVRKEK